MIENTRRVEREQKSCGSLKFYMVGKQFECKHQTLAWRQTLLAENQNITFTSLLIIWVNQHIDNHSVVSITFTSSQMIHIDKFLDFAHFLPQTAVVVVGLAVSTTQCHGLEIFRTYSISLSWVGHVTGARDTPGSPRRVRNTHFVSTIDVVTCSIFWSLK